MFGLGEQANNFLQTAFSPCVQLLGVFFGVFFGFVWVFWVGLFVFVFVFCLFLFCFGCLVGFWVCLFLLGSGVFFLINMQARSHKSWVVLFLVLFGFFF